MMKSHTKTPRVAFVGPEATGMEDGSRRRSRTFMRKRATTCLHRTIYGTVVTVLVSIVLYQSWSCFDKFVQEPTYITTDVARQSKAEFPAITICVEGVGIKADVLAWHGISSRNDYNDMRKAPFPIWESNRSKTTPEELFVEATYNVDELVRQFNVRSFKADTEGTFLVKREGAALVPAVTEHRHRKFGRCYTFHPDEETRGRGIYYIKFLFPLPVKVYLHRFGQFLDLSGRMGYKIFPHQRLEAQLIYEDIRMLPRESKESPGEMTCTHSKYDDCMYAALHAHMEEQAGCVAPWVIRSKEDKARVPVCTDPGKANTSFWIAWNRVTNQMGDCPNPCDVLLVTVGGKNNVKPAGNHSELLLYFAPVVKKSTEHFFYLFLSLVAEIGGYVGLLLGVSLFHGARWVSHAFETRATYVADKKDIK